MSKLLAAILLLSACATETDLTVAEVCDHCDEPPTCPPGTRWLYGRCEGGVIGQDSMLVVPVVFDMSLLEHVVYFGSPLQPTQVKRAVTTAGQRFREMSYGQFSLATLITPTVTLHFTDAELYTTNPDGSVSCRDDWSLMRDALAQVETELDVSGFEHFVFVFPILWINGFETCQNSVLAGGGGWSTGPNFDSPALFPYPGTVIASAGIYENGWADTLMHEALHSLGLNHANALECAGVPIAEDPATCGIAYYGGHNDLMGADIQPGSHTNARHKEYLGWIDVPEVLEDRVFWLDPSEPSGSALKLRHDKYGEEYLYLEYRTLLSPGTPRGLTITYYQHDAANPYLGQTLLLDMTPADSTYEGYTLNEGESFTDPRTQATIEVHSCSEQGVKLSITGL